MYMKGWSKILKDVLCLWQQSSTTNFETISNKTLWFYFSHSVIFNLYPTCSQWKSYPPPHSCLENIDLWCLENIDFWLHSVQPRTGTHTHTYTQILIAILWTFCKAHRIRTVKLCYSLYPTVDPWHTCLFRPFVILWT